MNLTHLNAFPLFRFPPLLFVKQQLLEQFISSEADVSNVGEFVTTVNTSGANQKVRPASLSDANVFVRPKPLQRKTRFTSGYFSKSILC